MDTDENRAWVGCLIARSAKKRRLVVTPGTFPAPPPGSPSPAVPLSHRMGEGSGVRAVGEWGEGESFAGFMRSQVVLQFLRAALRSARRPGALRIRMQPTAQRQFPRNPALNAA